MSNRHKYFLVAVYIYWIIVAISSALITEFGDALIYVSLLIIASLSMLFIKKQWCITLASMGLYFSSGLIMAAFVLIFFFGGVSSFEAGLLFALGILNFVIAYQTVKLMITRHNVE